LKRFVEGAARGQSTLFPECLDDWIDEDNPVRVIDVFVDELDRLISVRSISAGSMRR
jgi:transposase